MSQRREADLEGPITVGEPSPPIDPRPVDLDAIGYVEEEWFASGAAAAYERYGTWGPDGRWSAAAHGHADYRTRLVVRRPADPSRFDGTVVLEWLNVSVVEVAPEWAYVGPAMVDAGAAWVGLSTQALGLVGGDPLLPTEQGLSQGDGGIRARNPERYRTVEHPGDQFAFDIYAQVAAALRRPGAAAVAGGPVRRIVAAGQSQSAGFLTTFANALHPLTSAFDGYFVHSRGSGAARLDGAPAIRAAHRAGWRRSTSSASSAGSAPLW